MHVYNLFSFDFVIERSNVVGRLIGGYAVAPIAMSRPVEMSAAPSELRPSRARSTPNEIRAEKKIFVKE
jgi:hypothetical protein